MELGQKLKDARGKAGLKQEELAQQIGVSRQTVSNWENNRSYPDIASLLKLSELYGLTLDELLKEDKKVQAHFESMAARKKHFWQLALEYSLVAEIIGILLAGQGFRNFGFSLQAVAAVFVWVSLCMHIRLFDHTRQEIRLFTVGFCIVMVGMLVELVFPDFTKEASLLVAGFYLVRSVGSLMVLCSNVWSQFWKSPRFLLILLFLIGTPFLNLLSNLQSTGSFNTDSPFPQEYRIEQVLYPENEEADPALRIDLYNVLHENRLRVFKNGEKYESIGTFSYLEPSTTQREKGIWVLTPEENPTAVYRVAVEEDESVTLSYSENQQLQWKWLLREEYACSVSVATFGHTMYQNPAWLLPEEPDPEPYFKHTDVTGKATMTIALPGPENLTVLEEYHHGGSVEYAEYQLEAKEPGSFAMELETRYDGIQEYALYRIPYQGGEFRFVLTFAVGAKDALYEIWTEK